MTFIHERLTLKMLSSNKYTWKDDDRKVLPYPKRTQNRSIPGNWWTDNVSSYDVENPKLIDLGDLILVCNPCIVSQRTETMPPGNNIYCRLVGSPKRRTKPGRKKTLALVSTDEEKANNVILKKQGNRLSQDNVIKFITKAKKNCKGELIAGGETLAEVKT